MKIDENLNDNIGSILGRMIDTKAFWDLNKYIIYYKLYDPSPKFKYHNFMYPSNCNYIGHFKLNSWYKIYM